MKIQSLFAISAGLLLCGHAQAITAERNDFPIYFKANACSFAEPIEGQITMLLYEVGRSDVKLLRVTGYSDKSERRPSPLSKCRANAVAEVLGRHGVDRRIMSVQWNGATELPINTTDEEPQPLNRVVKVWLQW